MGRSLPYRILRAASILPLLLALPAPAGRAAEGIPIIVDGLPLDAKAIQYRDEVYVPAWILENYARTKVRWEPGSNLLEIRTVTEGTDEGSLPQREGTLSIRVGFYVEAKGFVIGRSTRLYVLNVDPKGFRFPDGKSPTERAHEGAIDRIGTPSLPLHEYLELPPTERFTAKGWRIVARMSKEEIDPLAATVDRYELLYRSLFYDLLTNLVIAKEQEVNRSGIVDDALKGIRIQLLEVGDDGSARVTLPNGLYFVFARTLYQNRQIVWDMPVAIRGGESRLELSNRNAALTQ